MENKLHSYLIHDGSPEDTEEVYLLHEKKFSQEEFNKMYNNLVEVSKMTASITGERVDMMDFIPATLCQEYGFIKVDDSLCIVANTNTGLIEKYPRDSKEETTS